MSVFRNLLLGKIEYTVAKAIELGDAVLDSSWTITLYNGSTKITRLWFKGSSGSLLTKVPVDLKEYLAENTTTYVWFEGTYATANWWTAMLDASNYPERLAKDGRLYIPKSTPGYDHSMFYGCNINKVAPDLEVMLWTDMWMYYHSFQYMCMGWPANNYNLAIYNALTGELLNDDDLVNDGHIGVTLTGYMFKYSKARFVIANCEAEILTPSVLLHVQDASAMFAQFTGTFYNELGCHFGQTNDQGWNNYMFEPSQPFSAFNFVDDFIMKSNDGPVFQSTNLTTINGSIQLKPRFNDSDQVKGSYSSLFASSNAVTTISLKLPSKGDVNLKNAASLDLASVRYLILNAPTVSEWTDTDGVTHATSTLTLPDAMADTYFADGATSSTGVTAEEIEAFVNKGWDLVVGQTAQVTLNWDLLNNASYAYDSPQFILRGYDEDREEVFAIAFGSGENVVSGGSDMGTTYWSSVGSSSNVCFLSIETEETLTVTATATIGSQTATMAITDGGISNEAQIDYTELGNIEIELNIELTD